MGLAILAAMIVVLVAARIATDGGTGGVANSNKTRCAVASASATEAIRVSLIDGVSVDGQAYMVKSKDFADVWFVSARLTGRGLSGEVGTWAMNTGALDGAGRVFSADGFADQYSDWPPAPDGGASFVDDGGRESRACVDG